MIDLYLKKVFSTRACWWYPDSFFHWRRPTSFTRLIGFGGLGWSGGDIRGLDDSKLVLSGGGFRYLIARLLNLHMGMDFARGDDEFAFYFQIGTGF